MASRPLQFQVSWRGYEFQYSWPSLTPTFTRHPDISQDTADTPPPLAPLEELRRSVLACLLWERTFEEAGETITQRIARLVPQCSAEDVARLAIEAREEQQLRHVPLLLVRELARHPERPRIAETLARVIQRADELAAFVEIYWSPTRQPLTRQMKKGLAEAFTKFNAHQLARYDGRRRVRLRDVLFLVHPRPRDAEQAETWKQLANGTLPAPDTWEVALSAGADARYTFERLLGERRLGYLALLRNLRRMRTAGVDAALVFRALQEGATRGRALPFHFVLAARAVPEWEPFVDTALQSVMSTLPTLPGTTLLLVDVSHSMRQPLARKAAGTRLDAATALALFARGVAAHARLYTFSDRLVEVPPRRGLALADALRDSQPACRTFLGKALQDLRQGPPVDRTIVITDEQSTDTVGPPLGRGYVLNVDMCARGIGYGAWTTIHGFSSSAIRYIVEREKSLPTGEAGAAWSHGGTRFYT